MLNVEKRISVIALKMMDNKENETALIMECIFELAHAIDELDKHTPKMYIDPAIVTNIPRNVK